MATREREFPFRFLSVVFILVGLTCLFTSALLFRDLLSFTSRALPVQGVVLSVLDRHVAQTSVDSRGRPTGGGSEHIAQVSFSTPDGRKVEFEENISPGLQDYHTNDSVPVLYDPADPQHARVNAFYSLWLLPIVTLVFGLAFGGAGLGVALGPARRGARAARDRPLLGDSEKGLFVMALCWNGIVAFIILIIFVFAGPGRLFTEFFPCILAPLILLGMLMLLGSVMRVVAANREARIERAAVKGSGSGK